MRCPDSTLGLYYLGNIHAHVKFSVVLSKG